MSPTVSTLAALSGNHPLHAHSKRLLHPLSASPLHFSAKPALHWAGLSADKFLAVQGAAREEVCQDLWCTANSSRGSPVDRQPPAVVLSSSISDLPFGYLDR